jgi:tryptophan-rich sensory protein
MVRELKQASIPFNPPGWVFGPVWTILYGLIGIAGWRIWRLAPKSSAMMLWGAQMVLNWLWSPAFFGAQAPELAFAIIIALLVATIGFILQVWKHDGLGRVRHCVERLHRPHELRWSSVELDAARGRSS